MLAQTLRRRRAALLKQFFAAEDDLRAIAEDREAELEERAGEERMARLLARLDDRSLRDIMQIDAALQRMLDGSYGRCLGCGEKIPLARLRALPTATHCVDCERAEETTRGEQPKPVEPPHSARLPPDLASLLDREVEETLRDLVRDDPGIDAEELRIVCRRGIVHLHGAVPSEAEHQTLLQLVTDLAGCEEVVDHLQVNQLLWERPDRTGVESGVESEAQAQPPDAEPGATGDVFESVEEGLDYVPPDRPPPEE